MAEKKLTEKQLQKLQGFQNKAINNERSIGNLHLQLNKLIPSQMSQLEDSYDANIKEQNDFSKELEEEYGPVSVNIQTGDLPEIKK